MQLAGAPVRLERPFNSDDLISEADYVKDERLPYWADLWASAEFLAEEVLTIPGAGRRAIELGCGLGLVTIAALRSEWRAMATDYYDDAILFAARNAWNAVGREPEIRHVDWSAMPDDLGRFDLVLAADVLYEPRYVGLVSGAIAATLSPGGMALIADPGRIAAEAFLEECRRIGMTTTVRRAVDRPAPNGTTTQRISLHELRWAQTNCCATTSAMS